MNDVDLDVGVIDELLSQLAPAAPLTTGQVARIRSRIDERKPSRRKFVAVGGC